MFSSVMFMKGYTYNINAMNGRKMYQYITYTTPLPYNEMRIPSMTPHL